MDFTVFTKYKWKKKKNFPYHNISLDDLVMTIRPRNDMRPIRNGEKFWKLSKLIYDAETLRSIIALDPLRGTKTYPISAEPFLNNTADPTDA